MIVIAWPVMLRMIVSMFFVGALLCLLALCLDHSGLGSGSRLIVSMIVIAWPVMFPVIVSVFFVGVLLCLLALCLDYSGLGSASRLIVTMIVIAWAVMLRMIVRGRRLCFALTLSMVVPLVIVACMPMMVMAMIVGVRSSRLSGEYQQRQGSSHDQNDAYPDVFFAFH
jgi:hypothetical protein